MLSDRLRSPVINDRTADLVEEIGRHAYKLEDADDLSPLLDWIGDAHFVLLGEASHGTSDYYTWRARLSRRLIREKGFSFIAVEGDWPDCYQVNRYIKHYNDSGADAYTVLHAFQRWPTWMWANWEVVALAEWLHQYNSARDPRSQVGFYGMDVYSLHESMAVLLDYITTNRPDALEAAQRAVRCFEPYGGDPQTYAWSTAMVPDSCEDEVLALLVELRGQSYPYTSDPEAGFNAEQNAWVTVGAERYYRTMIRGDAESWNIRGTHMADTLDRLMDFHGTQARAIVWEHNTHIGDARATDMASARMVNVGQLVRERHDDQGVFLAGFGSHRGTVIAGERWGAPMQRMQVPRAQTGSWEDLLHRAAGGNNLLRMADFQALPGASAPRGHRAIGVVYDPTHEGGNYVPSVLPDRYDAFLYLDETEALHPLHLEPETNEPPDTYPWGV
ncbi:MAG: erythromycin esterase family protein [Caldilineaceae bacterium]|nr:erythromycin esterase family protein [Caldilineaceae bacterium]